MLHVFFFYTQECSSFSTAQSACFFPAVAFFGPTTIEHSMEYINRMLLNTLLEISLTQPGCERFSLLVCNRFNFSFLFFLSLSVSIARACALSYLSVTFCIFVCLFFSFFQWNMRLICMSVYVAHWFHLIELRLQKYGWTHDACTIHDSLIVAS